MRARGAWPAVASAVLAAGMLAFYARAVAAHPLHTTLAQLSYDAQTGALEGSIRVFAGDLAAAVAKRNGGAPPADDRLSDAATFAYLNVTFRITGADGRAVPLSWCGSRRTGDLVWLCVRAAHAAAPASLRLTDTMLFEIFSDQINIVQVQAGAQRGSALYTRGDGGKRLF